MAAQHYNSCPFMAMKSTKLKHFNLDDKKKGGISLPSCSLHPYHKKNGESSYSPYQQMSDCFPLWHFFFFFPVLLSTLPALHFSTIKKKSAHPPYSLFSSYLKKKGGNDLLPVNTILPDFFFPLAFLFSSPRLAPLSNTYVLRQQHKARHRSLKRPKFFFYQIKFKFFFIINMLKQRY